jgi:hypothetical protein
MTGPRTPCHKLTFEEAVQIHLRLMNGEFHSRIAQDFDVNQGRISDIKFRRKHPGSYDEAVRRRQT